MGEQYRILFQGDVHGTQLLTHLQMNLVTKDKIEYITKVDRTASLLCHRFYVSCDLFPSFLYIF